MNRLTLDTLIEVMKRVVSMYKAQRPIILNQNEKNFITSLPSSFALQIHSLADLCGLRKIERKLYFDLFIRYLGIFTKKMLTCSHAF